MKKISKLMGVVLMAVSLVASVPTVANIVGTNVVEGGIKTMTLADIYAEYIIADKRTYDSLADTTRFDTVKRDTGVVLILQYGRPDLVTGNHPTAGVTWLEYCQAYIDTYPKIKPTDSPTTTEGQITTGSQIVTGSQVQA